MKTTQPLILATEPNHGSKSDTGPAFLFFKKSKQPATVTITSIDVMGKYYNSLIITHSELKKGATKTAIDSEINRVREWLALHKSETPQESRAFGT